MLAAGVWTAVILWAARRAAPKPPEVVDAEWQKAQQRAAQKRARRPLDTELPALVPASQSKQPTPAPAPSQPAKASHPDPTPVVRFSVTIGERAVTEVAGLYEPARRTALGMTWHPFGAPARVGPVVIGNGGFYSCTGRGLCTGAIDEGLPVPLKAAPDWQAFDVGYWPKYNDLSPPQRLAYVSFLNSKRRAKHVGQAYVWLYLYNLEYRLLIEPVDVVTDDEFETLVAEVDAIRQVYFELSAIRRYLPNLIAAARARRGVATADADPPQPLALAWDANIAMNAAKAFLTGQPITPQWALQIAILNRPLPRSHLDAVEPELRSLFALRYDLLTERQKSPKLGRSRRTIHYRRAMDGGAMEIQTPLPDVERQRAPFTPWIAVLDECLTELEPLRKARTSKTAGPLAALATFPHALVGISRLPADLATARDSLLQRCAAGPAALAWNELVRIMGKPDTEAKKREAVHAAQALGLVGLGFEPDPRFGTGAPTTGGEVVVFYSGTTPHLAPSPAFSGALLMVQCALQVSAVDGVSDDEMAATLALVSRDLDLPPVEIARLQAHLVLMSRDGATQRRAIAQLKTLPESQRHSIARAMVAIAGADGNVDAAEVRVLERLYATVGLPSEMLHHDIHTVLAGAGTSTAPATSTPTPVVTGSNAASSLPTATVRSARLDEEVIARKLAETARVHSLLATVFVEEAPESEPTVGAEHHADVRLELARMLAAAAPAMDRTAWEALCAAHQLLPDAALESVNELAVEMCGDPLAEGDDPIEINTWAAGEMGLASAPQEEEA